MAIKLDEARIRLLNISGGITPTTNNSLNLGTSSYKWKNVYATNYYGEAQTLAYGSAYPGGDTSKIWHEVATFSQKNTSQINTKLVLYVSNFYSTESSGILEITARQQASATTPDWVKLNFITASGGITLGDFVATWKYDSSTTTTTIKLYVKRSGWTSFNLTKIAEHAWGAIKNEWSLKKVSSTGITAIPTGETQVAATVSDNTFSGVYLINGTITSNIRSQNTSFLHYSTTATSGHWFNKAIYVSGEIYAGSSYNQKVLHAGNYTDYTVTKTGSGASGTWGISITGNAATATKATQDGAGNTITSKYVTLDTKQTISGAKTFSNTPVISNAKYYASFYLTPTLITGGELRSATIYSYVAGSSSDTSINTSQVRIRQYSYTTGSTSMLSYYDQFSLPATAADKTANNSYTILTTKNKITLAQGGTGVSLANAPASAIIRNSSDGSGLWYTATAAGAFYAESTNGLPKFGTLPVTYGGTGQTTAQAACNSFLNALSTGSSDPVGDDYYISQYAGGGTTTTTYHRRPVSKLYNYIKNAASGTWAISISGNAASASKLIAYEARATTTDLNKTANYGGAGAVFHLIASSSTTTGKCPTDANVLQMNWDNNGGYDSQFAISTGSNRAYFRPMVSKGTAWSELVHIVANTKTGSENVPVYIKADGSATSVSSNSVIVNLASTSGASIYAAAPRPGVTGTLPVANGGTGTATQNANRLVWTYSATEVKGGYHYANSTKVAINYSSEPAYNFYVSGTSYFSSTALFDTPPVVRHSGSRYGYIYFQNDAGLQMGAIGHDVGNSTTVQQSRFFFREWSANATNDTGRTDFYETYYLPASTDGLTENKTYNILTTKNTITLAQGGTGATSRSGAWTNIVAAGGTFTGSITISHATTATMDSTTTNPRIVFSENGSQSVGLVYTDYDSYRSPAGLKVLDMSGSNGNVWFEVTGEIIAGTKVTAPSFVGNLSGNATTATTLANSRLLKISSTPGTTGTSFNGSADATLIIPSTVKTFTELGTNKISSTAALYITPASTLYLDSAASTSILFRPQGTERARFDTSGNFLIKTAMYPGTNNTYNLGTSSYKWANVYATTFNGALSGNATTASALTSITTTDAASSSATWRRIWMCYSDNATGRPAYDDRFAIQTSTGTLKAPIFSGDLTGHATTATTANFLTNCYAYDGNSSYASYPWHKVATVTTTSGYADFTITFLVTKGMEGTSGGILRARLRTNGSALCESAQLYWLQASNLNASDFVGVYTNGSASCTMEIWVKITGQWEGKIFTVLSQSNRSNCGSHWTLSNTNGNGAASYTSGTAAFTSSMPVYTSGSGLYGAVWNDYAEYRAAETLEPGRVIRESTDGVMKLANERLLPGCEIISDTFGFALGKTDECKTPIAATGRVLAYPLEDRDSFELGQAVCSGPNGTISKMTREEIITYPERIIGTVSEIPKYDTWGTDNIAVNGRIWIRIK